VTAPIIELRTERIDPATLPKQPLKLDIGAGRDPRGEDFTTVDAFVPADIQAHAWAIPLPDNCVTEIWSSHMLEHIEPGKIQETLTEWRRILKSEARAIIQVPNFDYVARYWLCGHQGQRDHVWAEAMVYGLRNHPGEFHKCAFTAAILRGDLEGSGFICDRVEYRWTHNQETLQAVGRKPTPPAAPAS